MTKRQFQIARLGAILLLTILFWLVGLQYTPSVVIAAFFAFGAVQFALEIIFAAAKLIADSEDELNPTELMLERFPEESELDQGAIRIGDEI